MSFSAQQLFSLLPAVYRDRDAENGGALEALYAVLAQQLGIIEDNIQQLYDDQFIETCAPWIVPYIGDLIGYQPIYSVSSAFGSRAEVANTIGYRRRKGTLLALEQVTADVSGRTTVAVEEFRRLIRTESMRLVRPHHNATLNVRRPVPVERLNGAFSRASCLVDVRHIAPRIRRADTPDAAALDISLHGGGRANIPDIAVHLWRLKSLPVTNAPAFPVSARRYRFSPLGADIPLFTRPPARASFSGLTRRIDVPQEINRDEFEHSLRNADSPQFYGPDASILLLADEVPIAASQIVCANLADVAPGLWCTPPPGRIAIDPELGRIAFANDLPLPASLRVNFSYGTPAEIGGGPYDRSSALAMLDPSHADILLVIGRDVATPEEAIARWNSFASVRSDSVGIIVLPGFEQFRADLTGTAALQLPPGSRLAIVSGVVSGPEILWNGSCVTLDGSLEVLATSDSSAGATDSAAAGSLLLNGVWLTGSISVSGGAASIQIADCTLVPGLGLTPEGAPLSPGDPSVRVRATEVSLTLMRSITGPIAADAGGSTRICSSIVDATSPCCAAYAASDLSSAGADLHVEDSTMVGKVHTRTITLASNTIFQARRPSRDPWPAAVWASRRQTGCVRFCSLPFDSITPRRYECLPPDTTTQYALEPRFVTLIFGRPGYALLSGDAPLAVWYGADNGSQMGVFYQIQESEAVRNLQIRTPEYLPVALESGIFLHPSTTERIRKQPSITYGADLRGALHCCDETDTKTPSVAGIGGGLL